MRRTGAQRASTWRTSRGRVAAAALALGAVSALALAPGIAAAAPSPRTATEISTAQDAKLGTILVSGETVYTLKPGKKHCDAKCLKVWPQVLLPQGTMAATAGPGVDASKLGTTAGAGGALQVTYGGKPLYWFSKDKAPGQVKGNVKDKWGKWSTVATANATSGSGGTPTPSPTTPTTRGGSKNGGTGGTSF